MIAALGFQRHGVAELCGQPGGVRARRDDDGVGFHRFAIRQHERDTAVGKCESLDGPFDKGGAAGAQPRRQRARQAQRIGTVPLLGQHDEMREPR